MRAYLEKKEGLIAIEFDAATYVGRGYSATIHVVTSPQYKAWVIKKYRDPLKFDREKVIAMINAPPAALSVSIRGHIYPQYAWPKQIVRDQDQHDLGYLMPMIGNDESRTLDYFYDPTLVQELGMEERPSLPQKLTIAHNLATLLAQLHRQGHFVIDFKPENIKVFRTTHIVSLLDCDSFGISGLDGHVFPATNCSTEYIAPEVLNGGLGPVKLYEAQDRFALAVVLFRLLNNGIHPFQGVLAPSAVEAPTSDDKVKASYYPCGMTPHPLIRPHSKSIHESFDDKTRLLFDRAFATTNGDQRPSAKEWASHIEDILSKKALQRCSLHPNDPIHIRFAEKPCGVCQVEAVLQSVRDKAASPTISPAVQTLRRAPKPPRTALQPPGVKQWKVRFVTLTILVMAVLAAIYFFGARPNSGLASPVPHISEVSDCHLMFRTSADLKISSRSCRLPQGARLTVLGNHVQWQRRDGHIVDFIEVARSTPSGYEQGWVASSSLIECSGEIAAPESPPVCDLNFDGPNDCGDEQRLAMCR